MKNGSTMKVVGVYENEHEAIIAIEGLKQQGYSTGEISVLSKDKDVLTDLGFAIRFFKSIKKPPRTVIFFNIKYRGGM